MDRGADCYRRFLRGDESGLVEIIQMYNEGLTFYLNSFVDDLLVADELSEDTFVKIGVKKPRFSEKSSFKTWLFTIGRNLAVDHLRSAAKQKTVSIEEVSEQMDEKTAEAQFMKDEQKNILHQAMTGLKPDYRQVLWLTYFEDLSAKETARVMKKSVHGVENLLSRARQALKAELNRKGYTYENL